MKFSFILHFFFYLALATTFAQQRSSTSTTTLLLTGQLSSTLVGEKYQLLEEAAIAFEEMKAEAAKDNINLKIVSSYRSFERQLAIWNRKYKQNESLGLTPNQNIKKITEYSTIPGTSRHHWGTEIDVVAAEPEVQGDVLLSHLFENDGPYYTLKKWMDEHANSFGFFLVYTKDINRKGFQYEPWHYSYAPKSKKFVEEYKAIDLQEILKNNSISGNEHFTDQLINQYFEEYILGISSLLKEKSEAGQE